MQFTVYRGSWRNGSQTDYEAGPTYLLNDRQMMCCLGQIGYQIGVPLEHLFDQVNPADAIMDHGDLVKWYPVYHPGMKGLTEIFMVNDNAGPFVYEREKRLTELFADLGHTLRFEDGVAPWFCPVEVEEPEMELVCV